MDDFGCTLNDRGCRTSFDPHAAALRALLHAREEARSSEEELLVLPEPHDHGLGVRVLHGHALFDERNVPGHYEAVHQALAFCAPHEQPPFRVVDDETREASLRPVKAGVILFNLVKKRIVQIQNSYREITRSGRGRVYDGQTLTRRVFNYRLPSDWQIVP